MKKKLHKKIFKIAVPVAFENLLYNLMNFIDIFMVGRNNPLLGLGKDAVAGLGFANQIFAIFIVSLFGINSGGGILASQYFGAKNFKNLKKVLGMMIMIGVAWGILFTSLGIFIPKQSIQFFTNNPEIVSQGTEYFKIMSLSFLFISVGFALSMQLRAIGEAKYSFYSSCMGIIINAIINYLLIYGNFGFPAMGVVGAAYGTLIARVITTIYIVAVIYHRKFPIVGSFKEMFIVEIEMINKFIKISIPVFFHETFWIIGISVYSVIFGHYGRTPLETSQYVASINAISSLSGLVFAFLVGLGNATSVIIGNQIGAGNEEEAYTDAKELLLITFFIAIIVSIVFFALTLPILKIMKVDDEIYNISKLLLIAETLIIIARAFAFQFIVGIFRSGGDTLWTMYLDLVVLWIVIIPLTYLSAMVFKMPFIMVFFISRFDEYLKIIPCILRFKSKKWINNLVKSD